jgi:ABC-type branched-subunit amino acid transport system substrate-binding protein
MSARRRGGEIAIVVALVLLAGACSSSKDDAASTDAPVATLFSSDSTGPDGGTDVTVAVEDGTTATTGPAGAGGTATTAAGSKPGGTGSTGAGGSTPAPGAPSGGEIKIGIVYPGDDSALFAAFGATLLTGTEDWKTFIQPIIDDVNKNGGIAGRTVVPVWHRNETSSGTFASQASAACAHVADDDRVFAVIGFVLDPSMIDCLQVKKIPFIGQSVTLSDEALFARTRGYFYQPFQIRSERLATTWVLQLSEMGYFKGATVGLLRFDSSGDARFAAVVTSALSAIGVKVKVDVALRSASSTSDAGGVFSSASNAVLRLRSEGVTHVMLIPSGGAIPFAFMPSAESQGYRPRYALNSLEVPAFVAPNVPAAQLKGTIGVGWLPASDVYYKEVEHGVNAAEDRCYTAAKRNGDEAKRYCDGLYFLHDALLGATTVSPERLLGGVERLADKYNSPWTFRTRFGPGRYDGAASIRRLAFVDSCRCFRYSSGLLAAS